MRANSWIPVLLVVGACSTPSDDAQAVGANAAAANAATDPGARPAAPPPPVNLLTLAEGAVVVSASSNDAGALSLTDGDPKTSWSSGGPRFRAPHSFVFELRAPTRLDRLGVANAGARPGGVAGGSAARIRVEGSSEGADKGFAPVGVIEARADGETLVAASASAPVRWLRFTIEGTQDPAAAWAYLSDVIAYGEQVPPQGERFTGVFTLGPRAFVELHQTGAQVVGCYVEDGGHSNGELAGDVVDGVARLRWRSAVDADVHGVALMVVDSQGKLNGVRYRDRSRRAWGGPPAPAGTTTPCSATPVPANPIAAALENEGVARIYGILFDFDQATLKPESGPALEQLLAALQGDPALAVEIEGHTDSVGEDAYNLSLSDRRAKSVVAWLTQHGIAATRLGSAGKGETAPVADNAAADGRALNRRVEIRKR